MNRVTRMMYLYVQLAVLIQAQVIAASNPSSNSTTLDKNSQPSPFKIVIDGGSTGSRLHIFEFQHDAHTNKTLVERRGSKKVNHPLSDFVQQQNRQHHDQAGLHLLPLFKYASEIIPTEYHTTTSVALQATAGMRLVDEEEQHELYNSIHASLVNHDEFVFDSFERSDISTLDGVWEALFGVIAVNYLKGVIDVHMHYADGHIDHATNNNIDNTHYNNDICVENQQVASMDENANKKITFGALDMGGASMQIVFLPWQHQTESTRTCSKDEKQKLPSHAFFSTSYLSYGSDQFRERLWDTWIVEFQNGMNQEEATIVNNNASIQNPCSFRDHKVEWKGYTFIGTGDAKQCAVEVNRLIPHHEDIHPGDNYEDDYVVGGVKHPPIHGEFYAMSLFFFVMDCVRFYTKDEILLETWPNPSLHELSVAVDSFCSQHWLDEILNKHDDGDDFHEFTRVDILSERCFESVYIITLLRDGFGFDIHSRDITYTFLVDGSEVEWSLGMAISLFAGRNDLTSSYSAVVTMDKESTIETQSNNEENSTRDDQIDETSTNKSAQNNDDESIKPKEMIDQGKIIS